METASPAIIVVDLQNAIDDPKWRAHGQRNNWQAEKTVAHLLKHWRARGWPVYHVRHDSTFADSPYRPGQRGNDFKPEVRPAPGEVVIAKQTNSAFIGTNLETQLRASGHLTLVVAGVATNNSVEATVRMAGNLGFEVYLVEDCCFTFAKCDFWGRVYPASAVHAMSLSNLDGEYCTVLTAAEVLRGLR